MEPWVDQASVKGITMASAIVKQTWFFETAVSVKMDIMIYRILTLMAVNSVTVMWVVQRVDRHVTK